MKERVRRIFENHGKPLDAIIFANATEPHIDLSFFYVTGVASGTFEGSLAVAFPDGDVTVVTGALEAESARVTPELDVLVPQSRKDMEVRLRGLLKGKSRIGLNNAELTYARFLRLKGILGPKKFQDISLAADVTRNIKDKAEVEKLRQAGKIGDRVAEAIPDILREGMTELELAGEMEYRMCKEGAAGRSFPTIVAFGEHGSQGHYMPGSTKLKKGMTMVCDFGALYQRYCSDITRSYAFGRLPAEFRKIHETVEEAQQAAFDLLRPGVATKDVHAAAAKVIDAGPWKGKFIHGLGHSIGLAVHDAGFGLGPTSEGTLEPGMCVTVEPGIYVPGQGGVRIEDDVLITKTGFEFLTNSPRGYLEVA